MDRPEHLVFSRNPDALEGLKVIFPEYLSTVVAEDWLETPGNLMLTDGEGNFAMFDKNAMDGIHTGHYFFQARGREAIRLGKRMIKFFFDNTDAKAIRGLTPLVNQKARWMSRQLGFEGHGVEQTSVGPCELFILVRDN